MAVTSLGVLTIILGLTLLAFLWTILRSLKQRMTCEGKNLSPAGASESYPRNNRQHRRENICWPVRIESPGGNFTGNIKDLSLSGSFIICQKPLSLKEQFRLIIEAPDQEPMALLAEVVWSNAGVPDDKIVNRGMGIRFIHNTDEACRFFKTAVFGAGLINDPLPQAAHAAETV